MKLKNYNGEKVNDTWLSFREKIFHLCKEDLMRNPSDIVIFSKGMITDENGSLHFPRDKKGNPIVDNREVLFNKKEGKYYGGYYCGGGLQAFDTPEEAYEYANSLPFIG